MAKPGDQQQTQEPEGQQQPPDDSIQVPVLVEEPPKQQAVDSNGNGQTQTAPATRTFTQEDIEKARKEEKDKLYKSIEEMKAQVSTLTKEREEREAALKKQEEQAAAEAKKKAEEEMSAKELLEQQRQEYEARFAQIEADRQRSEALLEREREFSALQDYRAQRLAAEADNIMPELLDYVSGMSQEEIDASIALAIEKTNAVFSNIRQAQQSQRQQQKGASVTSPPTGPMEENNQGYETLTADDIRGMDMATYAKNRDRLIRAAGQNRNRGMFG